MIDKKVIFITALFVFESMVCAVDIKKGMQSMHKEINEEEIPFTEDLMREHGVLNRVLLIYEEIIRRLEKEESPTRSLEQAVTIIQDFIENYHEKLEEDYVFPLFEKHKKKIAFVKTLRKQHMAGRDVTKKLQAIVLAHKDFDKKTRTAVIQLLKKFIRMYRPHEAREDTELFPMVRSLLSEEAFKEMGEKFEDLEYEFFGKEGFYGIVKRVEAIEKDLGIYTLEQFS